MATTSQLLSEYIKRTSGQVSSSLRESEEQRFDAIKNIIKEEKIRRNEAEDIKPSEILKEFKARDTLQKLARAENKMKKFGITDKSVQQFIKEEEETRQSSIKGLEDRFKREREAKEQETKELLTKEEEKQTITNAENSVKDGSSPTYNYAIQKKPRRVSNVYEATDINYISAGTQVPDFSQGEAYFTEKDFYDMTANGTFEKAGITLDEIRKEVSMPEDSSEQSNYRIPITGAQKVFYKYLQSAESNPLRTAYNIELRDKKDKSMEQIMRLINMGLGRETAEDDSTRVVMQSSMRPPSRY
tara:strand:+ start:1322 stop:2224 length:903 start_codon:yes stop_codon:yes gene_type:complete